jgi:hypothetical protein
MLAQAASTMGGAMAGSVVGHGISNMLFGGRSAEQAPPPAEYANQARETTGNCDIPAKGMFISLVSFTISIRWKRSIRQIFEIKEKIGGGKLMIRFYKVPRSYWRRYDFMWILPRGPQYVSPIVYKR